MCLKPKTSKFVFKTYRFRWIHLWTKKPSKYRSWLLYSCRNWFTCYLFQTLLNHALLGPPAPHICEFPSPNQSGLHWLYISCIGPKVLITYTLVVRRTYTLSSRAFLVCYHDSSKNQSDRQTSLFNETDKLFEYHPHPWSIRGFIQLMRS
jgi:hypothetical protein